MEGDLPPKIDPAQSPLGCALRWLSAAATGPLPLSALLAELAGAFGVTHAGVAELPGGKVILGRPEDGPYPWRDRPAVLDEVAKSPLAKAVRDGEAHWLLTAVGAEDGAGWLLWLKAPATREWLSEEAGALALTGEALARRLRLPGEEPRWARQLLSQRRRQRFDEAAAAARRIAHDYGNILTGVLGFTELAQSQVPGGSTSAGYLDEVSRAALQGERLTNLLRLFARRSWTRNQPTFLAAAVADGARRLRGQFPAVRLDVNLPSDLPALAIDPEPLGHLLAQVLDNAAEACASHGSVRLSARAVCLTADGCLDLFGRAEPGSHVEITVEDDGCGLSAEARERLFEEPFFTTKPRQRGYGLAVAYGILCAHHGGLAVEPAGRGTVARVCLPVAAGPTSGPARFEASASPGESVLVVDDDLGVLHLVRTTLQRAGYRVETATSAADAVRSFTRTAGRFGLVLSNTVVPPANGFDLARQLSAHDARVNVLFMSGPAEPDPARPQEEFAGQRLIKPFGPDGLLRAVRRALERGPRSESADGTGDEVVRTMTH
jgi:signal transduction histidine kinase/ActR/RegA family two-component response regulator